MTLVFASFLFVFSMTFQWIVLSAKINSLERKIDSIYAENSMIVDEIHKMESERSGVNLDHWIEKHPEPIFVSVPIVDSEVDMTETIFKMLGILPEENEKPSLTLLEGGKIDDQPAE